MFKSFFPGDIRIVVMPYITEIMEMLVGHVISQLAVPYGRSLCAKIDTGLIQSDGVKRCEHSYVGKDRSIVLAVAVTVR